MFLQIDSQIVEIRKQIIDVTKDFQFVEFCQFKLNNNIHKVPMYLVQIQYPGVYLLEIKNNNEFKNFNDWIESCYYG